MNNGMEYRDNPGWFSHVSDAVYDMLAAALGLNPDSQSTMDRIVPAYVPGITTPQYNSNQDVCFYALSEETVPEAGYVTLETEGTDLTITKVIPVSLLLTFYGPHADDDAERVWGRLLVDAGYGSPRRILRQKRIVFNYGLGRMPPRPVSIPELEGTLWRRRCDLRLSLSYLSAETLGFTPVESVPEIQLEVAE